MKAIVEGVGWRDTSSLEYNMASPEYLIKRLVKEMFF